VKRRWMLGAALSSVLWTLDLRAAPGVPPPMASAGLERKIGAELPLEARFQKSDGHATQLGGVLGNGKPALLVLAYNRCEMLCSLVLGTLVDLLRQIEAEPGPDFSIVTLSIDPTETVHEAARMRTVLLERAGLPGAAPFWSFLVGKREEIDAVASSIGFRYAWDAASEQYAHPAVIFAVSGDGKLLDYFPGLDPDAARVAAALSGAQQSSSIAQTILSCFRFDTASSKYGLLIQTLLRVGAAVLAVAVAALIVGLNHRERRRREEAP
jgi:protein SCO1